MTETQRRAAADALLTFLERSDELNASDEVRLVLEVKHRGRPIRRMRYAICRGRTRIFTRVLVRRPESKN